MPVKDEKKWVHVRIRKSLAEQLRRVARGEHRRGIQTEANLAVATYIRQSLGMVVYGVLREGRCIYVGATSNICDRVNAHRKRFGDDVRIEVFEATTSFSAVKELESRLIQEFKKSGQADFNVNGEGSPNQKVDRLRVRDLKYSEKPY